MGTTTAPSPHKSVNIMRRSSTAESGLQHRATAPTRVEPPRTPPRTDGSMPGFRAWYHNIHDTVVQKADLDYDISFPEIPPSAKGFRWIHIPDNNLASVAICFSKCGRDLDPRISTMKLRPTFSQTADAAISTPPHAIHMEPSCTIPEGDTPGAASPADQPTGKPTSKNQAQSSSDLPSWLPLTSVYLPYMSWMLYRDYKWMQKARQAAEQHTLPPAPPPAPAASRTWPSAQKKPLPSLASFWRPVISKQKEPTESGAEASSHLRTISSQPRRTLDQFYYPALNDTSARDGDQTISKWTGRGVHSEGLIRAVEDSLLIMVDQFWCWVVDEKTIITSFATVQTEGNTGLSDFKDLYETALDGVRACADVWDFHALLVKELMSYLFNQHNKNFRDLIETYRWVTSKKAAAQSSLFQAFHTGYASGNKSHSVFDDKEELRLLLEVVDIIDELKMICHLLRIQRDVLKPILEALSKHHPSNAPQDQPDNRLHVENCQAYDHAVFQFNIKSQHAKDNGLENTKTLAKRIAGDAKKHVIFGDETVMQVLSEIAAINKDAEFTHQMLLDLLNLKSNAASLAEAHASLEEARSAAKQGRAVMLFTIVTIIFLPLSFFTSFYGQNVKEISGDDNNHSSWHLWRVATPITVVVIILALLTAYYITKPDSLFWVWFSFTGGVRERFRLWRRARKTGDEEKCE